MTEDEEKAWLRGERAAWRNLLGQCLRNLGYDSEESKAHRWIAEREDAIAQLRMLCESHGDNDWPETLHLADIVDKHLARHLK